MKIQETVICEFDKDGKIIREVKKTIRDEDLPPDPIRDGWLKSIDELKNKEDKNGR